MLLMLDFAPLNNQRNIVKCQQHNPVCATAVEEKLPNTKSSQTADGIVADDIVIKHSNKAAIRVQSLRKA